MKLEIHETIGNLSVNETVKTVTVNIQPSTVLLYDVSNTTITTAAADVTLADISVANQFIDPNGADRIVNLPSPGLLNHSFVIKNVGVAYNLTIKSGATTISTLLPAAGDFFVSSGTTWYRLSFMVSTAALASGWTAVADAWAYASANTITIPAGGTSIYSVGDAIMFDQHGVTKKFYVVTAASTLLTVTAGTDYAVENTATYAITSIYYSHESSPVGFPDWFNYTPSTAGLTLTTGTLTGKFKIFGHSMIVACYFLFGASSAVTGGVTFSCPFANQSNFLIPVWLQDSGTNTFTGVASLVGGTFTVYANNAAGTYTSVTALSSTVPFTWAVNDWISFLAVVDIA